MKKDIEIFLSFFMFISMLFIMFTTRFFPILFFVPFIIIPLFSFIMILKSVDGSNITPPIITSTEEKYKCPECGKAVAKDDHFCGSCRHELNGKNDLVINSNSFDPIYKLSEKELVNKYIEKEAEKLKIDLKNIYPNEIIVRKNILNLILSIIVFLYITSIFFHFPIATYIIGLIIILIFAILVLKYNNKSYILKEIKSRPKEKISNILMSIKNSSHEDNYKLFRISCLVLAAGIPLVLFKEPRIMYEKTDGGYGVRYYIYGITNYKVATIPEKYNNKPVVALRGNTFSNMKKLEKVILPDTIKEIRGQAFKNCINLKEVNMPKSLEYLGGGAFYNCKSIKEIELPNTLTYMGGEAFEYASSLEKVIISNRLQEIRGDTFAYCTSLKGIDIPDSVTRIGGHAFYGDTSLSEVILTENSQLNEIGSSAFRLCSSLTNITIPSSTYVNERAFKESPTSIRYFGEENNNTPEETAVINNISFKGEWTTHLLKNDAIALDTYISSISTKNIYITLKEVNEIGDNIEYKIRYKDDNETKDYVFTKDNSFIYMNENLAINLEFCYFDPLDNYCNPYFLTVHFYYN